MTVVFSDKYSAFQVKAPKGTMISLTGEPTAVDDGVYVVGDEGVINIDEQRMTDTLYTNLDEPLIERRVSPGQRIAQLTEFNTVIYAGTSTLSFPFKKGSKGGDDISKAIGLIDDEAYIGEAVTGE